MQNRVSVDFIYWYPILEEVFTDFWLELQGPKTAFLLRVVPELYEKNGL